MWAPLPVGVENAAEVLRKIASSMDELKKSGQAVGAQVLTNLAGFAPPTILSQAARLQARQPFFNLVVTNVPGPQFPLYLLGRRLEILYPVVPLAQKQALGIAVMSYDGHLGFGLLGDYDALPDIEELALDLKWAVAALCRAAGVRPRVGHRPQVDRQAHHRQLQPPQLELPNRGQATRRNQLAAPGHAPGARPDQHHRRGRSGQRRARSRRDPGAPAASRPTSCCSPSWPSPATRPRTCC